MSYSNIDRGRVVSLFSLPTNIPPSMDYRRDRRRGRWWAFGSPNANIIFAAGISLTLCTLLAIATFFFVASDPLMKPVPANRGAGHKGGSRAMATSMHERRGGGKKAKGRRDPVLTCIGIFVFIGILIVSST